MKIMYIETAFSSFLAFTQINGNKDGSYNDEYEK